MDENQVRKIVEDFIKKEEASILSTSLFGWKPSMDTGTASTSTAPAEFSLTYKDIIEALEKIPPLPANWFDEIRLSTEGFETMKEKLEEAGATFQERSDEIYWGSIHVLIRDYLPDDIALCVRNPQNKNELGKVVAIVALGRRFKPVPFSYPRYD